MGGQEEAGAAHSGWGGVKEFRQTLATELKDPLDIAAHKQPVDEGATPRFDWRELKRFGIRERDLPPGSEIRFRKVGLWEMYWKEIGAGLAIIGVETLLVAGLVIQLRQRKRTERALAAQ